MVGNKVCNCDKQGVSWNVALFSMEVVLFIEKTENYSSILCKCCLYNTTLSSRVDKEQENLDKGMPLVVNMHHMFCLACQKSKVFLKLCDFKGVIRPMQYNRLKLNTYHKIIK